MNDELQKELAAWLADLRGSAEGLTGFAVEQAPDVIKDVVATGRVESAFWMLVFTAFVVGLAVGLRYAIRFARSAFKDDKDNDDRVISCLIIFCFVGMFLIPMLGFASNVRGFITSWFAPRVFIMEYLADLVK